MANQYSDSQPVAAPSRARRWRLPGFFLAWTIFSILAVAWLIQDAARLGNTVLRVGTVEPNAWSDHVRETVALARLNFPWALAWFFLAPYALWIGARFSFDPAHWVRRVAILLVAGAGFVCSSQLLARGLVAGQKLIVMVQYSGSSAAGNVEIAGPHSDVFLPQTSMSNRSASNSRRVFSAGIGFQSQFVTNVIATNRTSRVVISGSATGPTKEEEVEIATAGMLSKLLDPEAMKELHPPGPSRASRWSAVLDAFAFLALVGLAHAGVFHRRLREREQQAALLESQLNQARLSALQAQLQPHFLFNALNGIATLLRRDPTIAGEMLQSLSDLLRLALGTSDRQEIPLREELDFLNRYLAIQQMRFGDRLNVAQEIDPAALDCLLPALLFQPLVENAIRHGLEPAGRPGNLRLTAAREENQLVLKVEDDGVGFTEDSERAGSGVGLANVRERLATLHGTAHEFRLEVRPEGGVIVVIRLPARSEPAATQRRGSVK